MVRLENISLVQPRNSLQLNTASADRNLSILVRIQPTIPTTLDAEAFIKLKTAPLPKNQPPTTDATTSEIFRSIVVSMQACHA